MTIERKRLMHETQRRVVIARIHGCFTAIRERRYRPPRQLAAPSDDNLDKTALGSRFANPELRGQGARIRRDEAGRRRAV